MVKEFRKFILRGNVIDLAVAVTVGVAFAALIGSFVKNMITPILAIPGDRPSFADYDFTIGGATFRYGAFLDDALTFLVIAAAIFFFVVVPINRMRERRKGDADMRDCPECLSAIPIGATRCAFCTAQIGAAH